MSGPPGPPAPLGVYLHFPFCAARCHYCAFYFEVGRADARAAYVDALLAELAAGAADPRFAGRPVVSIYLGGGTPSLLAAADVARLVAAVRRAFPVAPDAEVSLEANPDGLDGEHLAGIAAAGVNRLTLGWQSLRPEGLRALTRTHSVDENRNALGLARAAGLANVGVDLIFGRPGQTVRDWHAEAAEAAALGVDHVSAYELTFEEGTRLARRHEAGRYPVPSEEERAAMFLATDSALAPAGIERYEVSNFARPGRECRHNLDGWHGGDVLGLGASAASHVANERWTNVADLDAYLDAMRSGASAAGPAEVLDPRTWAAEDLYLGLRTRAGIDASARLARVPAPDRESLESALAGAEREGLLVRANGRVRVTGRGLLFVDSVLERLLAG